MFFGSLLSLILFTPLSYIITRMSVRFGYRSDKSWVAIPVVFLSLLIGLSLLALAIVAAISATGTVVAVAGDAVASSADVSHPGVISAIGALVMGLWGLLGIMTGPAAAFVAAKVTTILTLIAVVARMEEDQVVLWLPIAGAIVGGVCMWPFTTFLTLGF